MESIPALVENSLVIDGWLVMGGSTIVVLEFFNYH